MKRSQAIAVVVTFFVCIVVMVIFFVRYGQKANEPQNIQEIGNKPPTSNIAYIVTKNYLKDHFSGKFAKMDFPTVDFTSTSVANNRYKVKSYFDYWNAFNAKMRVNYVATSIYSGSGNVYDEQNWNIEVILDE